MNILVISHTYIASINRDKWKVLANQHPDISLTVLIPRSWPTHMFHHHAENLEQENLSNCTFIALNTVRPGNELLYGYKFLALLSLLKKINPDVIHVEQGAHAYSYFQAMVCAKLLRLKSKFCFFTWINWEQKHSWKYNLGWKFIEWFTRRHTNGIIAGNHDAAKLLKKNYPTLPIAVLPQLGVNTQIFTPAFKETNHIIGYIGRLVEEKGIMHLLKAFEQLHPLFPSWQLLIVGSGSHKKTLIDFVATHHLASYVDFFDPVPHEKIATLLKSIGILVLPSYDTPSWKEQFGHVLIEAMACKIPVIGSTGGEIPNVVQNAGLVFDQTNVTQLKNCLEKLMSRDEERKVVGEQGYHKVNQEFTHDSIAKKTYDFWHTIV